MTGLLLLFGLLALAILAAVATAIALLWIWGRRHGLGGTSDHATEPTAYFDTGGGSVFGIPIVVDERMPETEIELVSERDRVRVVNLAPAFAWPNPAPAAYDWQRDRAWSERRV